MTADPSLKTSGVYVIVHRDSGKVYVGSSNNLLRRWTRHRHSLDRNRHHSPTLQRAWNKYGPEVFVFAVVRFCPEPDLIPVEQRWMDEMDAAGERGYNSRPTADSTLGAVFTDSTRAKMSASRKAIITDEYRAALSLRMKGVPKSPEQRAKMSTALKGRKKSPQEIANQAASLRGRKLTPEHCAKLSAALKGIPKSPEHAAAVSATKKGVPLSAEHRAKLSEARRKRPPLSAETRAKIGASVRAACAARKPAPVLMVQGELFD